jgi:hypothetical protein
MCSSSSRPGSGRREEGRVHIDLTSGGTLAFVVGGLIALATVAGAIAFALWYSGDQNEI